MAKFIFRVKEAASSERVKNVVKTTAKVVVAIGVLVIAYKFGKSMGKLEESLKLVDSLCNKAHDKFGRHVSIKHPDGSKLDLQDALEDIKAEDIVNGLTPNEILDLARKNASKVW